MGKARITFYGAMANITGQKTADVEASTLKEALAALTEEYGEQFKDRIYDGNEKLRRFINIYVNGKDVRFLSNLETELNDEDVVSIIPAAGGG